MWFLWTNSWDWQRVTDCWWRGDASRVRASARVCSPKPTSSKHKLEREWNEMGMRWNSGSQSVARGTLSSYLAISNQCLLLCLKEIWEICFPLTGRKMPHAAKGWTKEIPMSCLSNISPCFVSLFPSYYFTPASLSHPWADNRVSSIRGFWSSVQLKRLWFGEAWSSAVAGHQSANCCDEAAWAETHSTLAGEAVHPAFSGRC